MAGRVTLWLPVRLPGDDAGSPGNAVDLVVRGGVEPPTFRFSGGRSYQLSYLTLAGRRRQNVRRAPPTRAVLTGFEPATSTLTGWRALLAALQDHAALAGCQRCPQRDSNPCRRLERAVS